MCSFWIEIQAFLSGNSFRTFVVVVSSANLTSFIEVLHEFRTPPR
jgi:hypothetical protein